jgi:hypothetical protein
VSFQWTLVIDWKLVKYSLTRLKQQKRAILHFLTQKQSENDYAQTAKTKTAFK